MSRELLKQALEALEIMDEGAWSKLTLAIREYLDNTKDAEPVAWIGKHVGIKGDGYRKLFFAKNEASHGWASEWTPLYLYLHPAPIHPGMVLVPEEPTHRMLQAAWQAAWDVLASPQGEAVTLIYKAMLTAAKGE